MNLGSPDYYIYSVLFVILVRMKLLGEFIREVIIVEIIVNIVIAAINIIELRILKLYLAVEKSIEIVKLLHIDIVKALVIIIHAVQAIGIVIILIEADVEIPALGLLRIGSGHGNGVLGIDILDLGGTVTLHADAGRNELADDNIFLKTEQRIDLALDSGICENTGGLLEACGGEEGIGGKRSLGDTEKLTLCNCG